METTVLRTCPLCGQTGVAYRRTWAGVTVAKHEPPPGRVVTTLRSGHCWYSGTVLPVRLTTAPGADATTHG